MKDVEELRVALLGHYDRHARALPWRRATDPYRILVSEIMLQQTRVETVKGYYDPWLERFPSVDALAAAEEDEVLKAWEGLGYYRRARNLHRAARVVRERYGGRIPSDQKELRALPGVGEYTAGAVASIAFGAPVPAVDGNVRRVLARLHDVAEPTPAWLRARATELVDPLRPGDWNQALMELGATVCTPRAPKCDTCPWGQACRARAGGTQLVRPARARKRAPPSVEYALAVLHAGDRVLLTRRPTEGLLGGMWAFPEAELGVGSGGVGGTTRGGAGAANAAGGRAADTTRGRVEALELARRLGLRPVAEPAPLPEVRHRFTHLDARYRPWSVEVAAPDGAERAGVGDARREWVDPMDLGDRALPRAQTRVLHAWVRCLSEAS